MSWRWKPCPSDYKGALGLFSGLTAFPRSCIGGNMRKRGFFIGFLSEAKKERDNQNEEMLKLLKEQERRNSHRDILGPCLERQIPELHTAVGHISNARFLGSWQGFINNRLWWFWRWRVKNCLRLRDNTVAIKAAGHTFGLKDTW